jgi:N-acetyl-gamma-glutamyl-phosphate reductase
MRVSAALLLLWASSSAAFAPSSIQSRFATSLNKYKVFIDGEAGTTGLQVRGRIEARDDLVIISPPDELRKDEETRKALINEADVVILCTCNVIGSILLAWKKKEKAVGWIILACMYSLLEASTEY